jgi:hypothetical protein
MATYTRRRSAYSNALDLALKLSVRDQRRLRAELAKYSRAKLVRPSRDPNVIRSARLLAEEIRQIAQTATTTQSLDDGMRQLRGRSWS